MNKLMDFKSILKLFSLLGIIQLSSLSQAQSHYDPEDSAPAQSLSLLDQTKSDFYIITAAGLGGAVLGLSTLSFADHPSDEMDNIWTGAAIGIILGVCYVAYRQALGPSGMWVDGRPQESASWDPRKLQLSPKNFLSDLQTRHQSSYRSSPLALDFNFSF